MAQKNIGTIIDIYGLLGVFMPVILDIDENLVVALKVLTRDAEAFIASGGETFGERPTLLECIVEADESLKDAVEVWKSEKRSR